MPHFLRAALLALLSPALLGAQTGGGALLTRLGDDTVAVERFSRTGDELRAVVLLRVPRTTLTVYRMRFDGRGEPELVEATRHDPALGPDSPALSRDTVRFSPEAPLPFIDMVHGPFELMLARAHAAPVDSITLPLASGRRTQDFRVARLGPGRMTVTHPFRGTMRVRVDERGRLLELDASETTRKLRVERVAEVPIEALARDFAARDARGAGIGELSGRGETDETVAGATIVVDYGRPLKRGREIFGALVPYGEVWRTGANQATRLTTDRDLVIAGTRVPAGAYSVFTIPGPASWTLILNLRPDISGTAHDPAYDFTRVPMAVRTLPEPVETFTIAVEEAGEGGVLRFQWDRTEAVAPFAVVPP